MMAYSNQNNMFNTTFNTQPLSETQTQQTSQPDQFSAQTLQTPVTSQIELNCTSKQANANTQCFEPISQQSTGPVTK